MIYYDPRRWTQVILSAPQSAFMRRMALDLVGVALFSAAITAATDAGHIPTAPASPTFYPLMGILLSLLLAFRTNTAYDRWWEGRKHWGSLVNNCRNLALALGAMLPEGADDLRRGYATDIANYCFALKGHLRGQVEWEDLEGYPEAWIHRLQGAGHVPNAIAARLLRRTNRLFRQGILHGLEYRNLKPQLDAFTDVCGACERIRNTPIPFSYDAYVKFLVLGYCFLLPFGLHRDFGWGTVPVAMVAFMALAGLEMLASEIEDPFGTDENDLPTHQISQTIRRNVFEILTAEPPYGEPVVPFDPTRFEIRD